MTTATRTRWYTHGWNREISWRLILGILPRVPVPLRRPLHLVFTTICFVAMGTERRAARRNLERITGARGAASLRLAWRLFHNFSRFMAAYTDLPPWSRTPLGGLVDPGGGGLRDVEAALAKGRGLILLGMHLGQWELALSALASAGYPVTVVMRREDREASRFADESRRAAGLRILHAGENAWLFVELLSTLRRNGIVAMQGDRHMGGRTLRVPLFGEEVSLPAGPWELAAASGSPILPGVLVFEGDRRYRLVWGEPIQVAGRRSSGAGARDPVLLAKAMEAMIRRYPDQWFNFYDVWESGSAKETNA